MDFYCYANGKYIRRSRIKVSINDLVFLRGYGAFDYLRTYHGKPFKLNLYLNRFFASAKGMQLRLPLNQKQMTGVIHTLLKKNKIKAGNEIGIRFLITGGYSLDAFLPATPNLFILPEDLPVYPKWWTEKGIKLQIHEHGRELPKVKTTNYLTAIRLAQQRRKAGAQDTLYVRNNRVLETTRNNFFIFKGNRLITAGDGILYGITRGVTLKLAKRKFKVEERDVKLSELKSCDEAFVTGTTRGITPVIRIDHLKIGNGKPGKNTLELIRLFEKEVSDSGKISRTK